MIAVKIENFNWQHLRSHLHAKPSTGSNTGIDLLNWMNVISTIDCWIWFKTIQVSFDCNSKKEHEIVKFSTIIVERKRLTS